jgi:hypothetical protein
MAEEILSKHLVSGLRWYDVRLGADVSFHQIRPGYRVLCSFKKQEQAFALWLSEQSL